MSKRKIPTAFPKVKVMRGLDGLGLFAMEPVKKGKFVIEYVGEVLSPKDGDDRDNLYIFSVNDKTDIDGSFRYNLARYVNHSCRPNCEAEDINNRVFIIAKKNIMLGEEFTYDYGKEYVNEYIKPKGCRCAKCMPSHHPGLMYGNPPGKRAKKKSVPKATKKK